MPTVVFFDREDVLNFTGGIPDAEVLALSPSAFVAAQQAGFIVGDGAPLLSGYGHARCTAAAGRALREFDRAAALTQLPDAIVVMARQSVWGHAALVQRLRCSLPDAPWTVRHGNGNWINAADLLTLQSILLPRIWDYGLAHRIELAPPNFPALFKYFNRLAAILERRMRGTWVATPSRKLKNGLSEALASSGATVAVFQPTSGGWRDYIAILRGLHKGGTFRSFRIAPFSKNASSVLSVLSTLRDFGKAFSDPLLQSAWKLYESYLAAMVPSMLAMTAESSKILSILQVRSVAVFEANSWPAASLMDAAGNSAIKRVVFNHNSHPASGSPIANSVLSTLLRHRTCNALVDIAAVWSPSVDELLQVTAVGEKVQVFPVRLNYPGAPAATGLKRPLRILHAGNYQNWSDFFPWVAETADEYLNGVEALAATVEQLDGIELVIRVRPKREVDATVVEARLGRRRNVRVCGTEQDFLKQLAESDLLVAHFSTTIEQALQMGKPVLLWGSADRYRQFAGREIPPIDTLEDAVYVARDLEKLSAMLVGIRDVDHAVADCTQSGKKYAFSPSTPGLDALVTYLINPSPESKTVS